jgi:uncharacterized damage-inducible protein DinB
MKPKICRMGANALLFGTFEAASALDTVSTMCAHKEQLLGFARYNSEFNRRLFDQLLALPDEERKRDLGAFFNSIRGTLNHILLADRIWLGRGDAHVQSPDAPSWAGNDLDASTRARSRCDRLSGLCAVTRHLQFSRPSEDIVSLILQ